MFHLHLSICRDHIPECDCFCLGHMGVAFVGVPVSAGGTWLVQGKMGPVLLASIELGGFEPLSMALWMERTALSFLGCGYSDLCISEGTLDSFSQLV